MPDQSIFTDKDREQIRAHGLSEEVILKQINQFKMPPPYIELVRPCVVGDGIEVIQENQVSLYSELFEKESLKGRCMKFVPASGAATRMFRALQKYYVNEKQVTKELLTSYANQGQKEAEELLIFFENIKKFAFFPMLKQILSKNGLNFDNLYIKGQYSEILRFLLTEEGLNFANIPKALIPFHSYNGNHRTAFEEHIIEAIHYVADGNRKCVLHFTVAQEHMSRFQKLTDAIIPQYEKEYNVKLNITFSIQKKSTDTIAVDMDNNPFRLTDGRLLFRPGGHGALIENLNDLRGDIIFIKNIDNVVPDHLKPETYKWKKILGGILVSLQNTIHSHLKAIYRGNFHSDTIEKILLSMEKTLSISIPKDIKSWDKGRIQDFIFQKLNRPIRVCGMVRNVGEPGGGPFWVRNKDGEISKQIVEMAQIDPNSEDQQEILRKATHFNPVDLVCGVRDWKGESFDLRNYVDPDAVFISQKSKDGKDLKALELPGLWNGAMAYWITVFVEVPLITFNPVKTVNALLRAEHQPV